MNTKIRNNNIPLHNINEKKGEGPYRIVDISGTKVLLQTEDINQASTYIGIIHSEDHINDVMLCSEMGCNLAEVDLTEKSFKDAIESVAISIQAAQPILESQPGHFAIIRPPGHHAGVHKAGGFCLFNNVACATEFLTSHGLRIAILDIDIHHGNGTQEIFYERDDVLFVSLHKSNIYPYSGDSSEKGSKKGLGYTLNIPIIGNISYDEYLPFLEQAITCIKNFDPDALAISIGFDTYYKDNLMEGNGWSFVIDDYFKIGQMIKSINKPVFLVLEGGYHTDIELCSEALLNGLNKME
jgi:acetoin utilization deacetylase AcuC-like enzyme